MPGAVVAAVVAAVVDSAVDTVVGETDAAGVDDRADASVGIAVAVGDVPGDVGGVLHVRLDGTCDGDCDVVACTRFPMRCRSTRTSGREAPASASYDVAPTRVMGMAKARNGMLHTSRESWMDRTPMPKHFGANGKRLDLTVSGDTARDGMALGSARQGSSGRERPQRNTTGGTEGDEAAVDHRELRRGTVTRLREQEILPSRQKGPDRVRPRPGRGRAPRRGCQSRTRRRRRAHAS